ncbi:MAG: hypothetical protein GQ564_19535 [Bacteroidales bacterium]|nr:hypothetical protein [Bacteroidales bacterium]
MKLRYKIFITITSTVGVLFLILYLYHFKGGFSQTHSAWGEFGSFFGGIISPLVAILAFIAILYNFELTKEQFSKNSNNSTFFSLLDLHNKKVSSIAYLTKDKTDILSFHAFKLYNDEYQKIISKHLKLYARNLICNDIDSIGFKGYNLLWEKLSGITKEFRNESTYCGDIKQNQKIKDYFIREGDTWELLKGIIGSEQEILNQKSKTLEEISLNFMLDTNSEERVKFLQYVHSLFYQEFGHILGHYFRNIHYILEHIDSIKPSKNYGNIFRAQLSRYELALMYYNSLSMMSSSRHVKLLKKYDIFNGLYSSDIFYTPDKEKILDDLNFRITMKNAP